MAVAAVGILVNGGTALMFAKGHNDDLNRQAAYLHMLLDAVVAAGVVVAGLLILLTGSTWIDPACGLLVAAMVALSSWRVLRRSLDLAMDAVPDRIDPQEVRAFLEGTPGVESVHDLHIWAMSTTETALTVHLVAPGGLTDAHVRNIGRQLHDRFAIEHPTVQVERGAAHDCPLAPDQVV
jgi:cobalt-zinc-cadmium efflux system protein